MKQILLKAALFFQLSVGSIHVFAAPYSDHKTLDIGASAPDFSLPGTDGKMYSLASFKSADVLVIIFTCNHCPTAQAYEDRLIQLKKDYGNKAVAIVAVMPNDPKAIRLKENYIPFVLHVFSFLQKNH